MSFILDALQKADRERQAQPVACTPVPERPSHHAWLSQPDKSTPARRYRPSLGHLALASVLLMALAWFASHTSAPPLPASPATNADTLVRSPTPSPEAAPTPLNHAPASPTQPPPTQLAIAAASRPHQADRLPTAALSTLAAAAPTAAPTAAISRPASPAAQASADMTQISNTHTQTQEDAPLSLAELPTSLRSQLAPLVVTAHAHSRRPGASYVFINDRLLHEGESLGNGLQLERITANGMIFSYQGYRFWRGLQP